MQFLTKYITPDEFKEYFGIDLDTVLHDDANPSNKSVAFLRRIEDRLAVFIDANLHRNIDREYPCFSDYQKEHYKLALLEQAYYIFRNGDISTDSGYEADRGNIADNLSAKSIAPNCMANLVVCGIWNRQIPHRTFWGI